jgi:RNA-directed DNA polymerase
MTDDQLEKIKLSFSRVYCKADLVELINCIAIQFINPKCEPIDTKFLDKLSRHSNEQNRYFTFTIAKKSGGVRQIHSPRQDLLLVLKCLNIIFQCLYEPNEYAFGFVSKKSIVQNARLHSNKKFVFNSDLKDFFYSFDFQNLKKAFTKNPFHLKNERQFIAYYLALLCTQTIEINGVNKMVLPQGSPASPILTNILCMDLDRRLGGLAKRYNAKYSRYADDITFSANHNVFIDTQFIKEFRRIVEINQNLKVNNEKTRLQNNNYRQEVTGLTVNEKVNVPRKYIKQIRMWLYYWERYGYTKALVIFSKDYVRDNGHRKTHFPRLSNVLYGKLQYLKMVRGVEDSTYKNLNSRFEKLNQKKTSSIDYI